MAQQKYYIILTDVGKSKIANATVLNEKVQFTKMQLGDGGGNLYDPNEKQTELKNKVWEGNISNVKVDENNRNWIVVETAIPGGVGGWTVREVGIFDDEGNLLAIGKYPETYKPVVDDGCVKDLFVRVILMVVNTTNIALKIDPTVILASMKNLEDLRKEVNTKLETLEVDLTTKIGKVQTSLDSIELTAEKVSIADIDNNFTSETVEGALQELADKDKSLESKIDTVEADLKQSVSSGKQIIATATTGKGVPTNGGDSFQTMADNIDSIKTKLPIQEGDVGVTEDNEGKVYDVVYFEDRQKYTDPNNPVELVWEVADGRNVFVDDQGYVYSLYSKYDSEGTLIWTVSGVSNGRNVFVDNQGNFYLCYGRAGEPTGIKKFDSNGILIWNYAGTSSSAYIVGNSQGYIFIANGSSILKISPDGELVKTYTTAIANAEYISVDKYDNLYVTLRRSSSWSGRVMIFDSNLNQLKTLHIPYAYYAIADNKNFLYVYTDDYPYYVIKYNLNENSKKVWEQRYDEKCGPITVDNHYCIYLGNAGNIIKYDYGLNIKWEYNFSYMTISNDNKGNVYLASTSKIVKLKDNYTLEKLAVLKEREVTE